MHHVVEYCNYGELISRARIFCLEGHHYLIEISNGCSESNLLSIPRCHPNLIIATKPIHEREHGVSNSKIYLHDHIWQGEFILGARVVEIPKVDTTSDLPILFLDRYNIGQALWVLDQLDESYHKQLYTYIIYTSTWYQTSWLAGPLV